jgi:hypothetical protein
MQGLASLSLIILGSNLPVTTIDLGDFEESLGPLTLEARAPIVIQATGSGITFVMMENRVSLEWSNPLPADARDRMTQAIAVYAREYAGRRGPAALGQNFRGILESPLPGRDFVRTFLDTGRVERVLMSESPPDSSLTLFFNRGRENRAQLVLSAPEEDAMEIAYAFNFHFDLTKAGGVTFEEALQDWEKSEQFAGETVDALVALMSEGA